MAVTHEWMMKKRHGIHKESFRDDGERQNLGSGVYIHSIGDFERRSPDSFFADLSEKTTPKSELDVARVEFEAAAGKLRLADVVAPRHTNEHKAAFCFHNGGLESRRWIMPLDSKPTEDDLCNPVLSTWALDAVPWTALMMKDKMESIGIWMGANVFQSSIESLINSVQTLGDYRTRYEQIRRELTTRLLSHASVSRKEEFDADGARWIQNPEEILRRLENPDTALEDQVKAVLFAEITAFSADEKRRMLNALFTFANDNRFSTEEKIVVSVGSAVRKFAMNMPVTMLDQYAQLFVPSATESISCRIELELAKGASWRLAKLPSAECASAKQLETRLAELASDYLAPRLILQENYASIALAATVGVILMNGESQGALLKRVHGLRAGQHKMNWFRELLADRLLDIAGKQVAIDSARADRLRAIAKELDGAIHC